MKYMGPGTHIIDRLMTNVQPTNKVDAASMIHDLEYLNPYVSEQTADQTALDNSGGYFNPLKILMKVGFKIKDIAGGYNSKKNYKTYLKGLNLLTNNYKHVINKYNLKLSKPDLK